MRIRDFSELVVIPTLNSLSTATGIQFTSRVAVDLLLGTAAHESGGLKYIKQVNSKGDPIGPALGFFQMEPDTIADLYTNYLRYRPKLLAVVEQYKIQPLNTWDNMISNLPYSVVIARLQYYRVPAKLPHPNSPNYVEDLAKYWKTYWNTHLGKGTVEEFVHNYFRYVGK